MKAHRPMGKLTQKLIDFVAENSDCTLTELRAIFAPGIVAGKTPRSEAIAVRCSYLVRTGRFVNTGGMGESRFSVVHDHTPVKLEPIKPVIEQKRYTAALVPSPKYDRMSCPKYIPSINNFSRTGSVASMVQA